jgi:predicted nucleotide-binding protein
MARRTTPSAPERPVLTVDQLHRRVEQLRDCISGLEAFEPEKVQGRFNIPEVTKLQVAIDEALSTAFGHGTPTYNRYRAATRLDSGSITMRADPMWGGHSEAMYDAHDTAEARHHLAEGKQRSIGLLQQAISALEYEIADRAPPAASEALLSIAQPRDLSKVFVVHGHDHGARDAVARFLEKIDLEAIILQEQPDQGLTIIEKFETYANQVGFAVVLLTPDDIGGAAVAPSQASRARQNVIFELGYFAGKLGRGRACLLRKGDVEIPSDLYGVIYTNLDADEGWKLKLAKEMKAAGLKFDGDKVF